MDGTTKVTQMNQDYERLKECLAEMEGVVVAYSGGVDSSVLLAAAVDALGDRALAVSGESASYPLRESAEAKKLAKKIGARHRMVATDEMDNPEYRANPRHRCYLCKSTLFTALWQVARDEGLAVVVEGSNQDDLGDFRPGMKAARDLAARSPFVELGLGKAAIRAMAKARDLPVWDKPAAACLASRVPYGQLITPERLKRIELTEDFLGSLGFVQIRARDHGNLVRLEIGRDEMDRFLAADLRLQVAEKVKELGYTYVSLDLLGYRTGAMNEAAVVADGDGK